MPPLRVLLRAVGRFAGSWVAAAVSWLTAGPAAADHALPPPARSGLDWTTWLLVAGAIAAVCLAAWAFFAPVRPEDGPGPGAGDGPEPESRSR